MANEEVEDRSIAREILDEIKFNRDRKYLSNKERKGSSKNANTIAICGTRDPKDGLRKINLVPVERGAKKPNEKVKVIKCISIGIGANRIGEKVKALSLPLKGRGFIDYRG